ncbi:MAG: substrate-binding domain-containing protein [Solirubrobacteraceae bacterium]
MLPVKAKAASALVLSLVVAAVTVGVAWGSSTSSVSALVKQAKQVVAAATARNVPWDGPTSGPRAQKHKSIVVVASDLTNTGVLSVANAIKNAAKVIGWSVTVLNGQGTTTGLQQTLNEALADKPSGIVDDGYDFTTVTSLEAQIHSQGIPQVAWNGGPTPGPVAADHIYYNVAVSAPQIAKIAADYAIARSNGKAHVVIFTDNEFAVAEAKANDMRAVIQKCKTCKVLAYENTPIADVTARVPPLTAALLQKYGKSWTYSLAINDNYFEAMAPALAQDGVAKANEPINISAGDGSPDAFQRIRTGNGQAATVAAPLGEQGWQVVDELNRAFAHQAPDNFVAAPRLFDKADINTDGGPQDTYAPNNHYQQHYMKIWGVK